MENDSGQSVGAVFYAHLDSGGKTVARQKLILDTWSLVLEDYVVDVLRKQLSATKS